MAMMRTGAVAAMQMTGWLEEVQRDPRTLGAFRRRIESLLRDPAVARRVAVRLEQREGEGRSAPSEVEPAAPCAANPCAVTAPMSRTQALVGAFLGREDGSVSLIGRCDCASRCCLMVPDLRGRGGMGLVVPPRPALPH